VEAAVEVEVANVVLGMGEVVVEGSTGDKGDGAGLSMLSPIPYVGIAGKSEGTTTPLKGGAREGTGEARTLPMMQATSRH
jgi:hypothetical protein